MGSPSQNVTILELVNQFGLMGIVSVMLATLTVLVALVGIYAFFDVRRTAKRAAKAEATVIAREVAESRANDYLQAELPGMIAAYADFAKNAASAKDANDIAQVQDDK